MPDNVSSGMSQPTLVPGMVIVLEALDPSAGDNIAGVIISDVVISGTPADDFGDEGGNTNSGPYMLVPGPQAVATTGQGTVNA